MIQDTSQSPEVYLSAMDDHPFGWGLGADNISEQSSSDATDYNKLRERSVLWAVNIPGEAMWCTQDTPELDSSSKSDKISHSLWRCIRAHVT